MVGLCLAGLLSRWATREQARGLKREGKVNLAATLHQYSLQGSHAICNLTAVRPSLPVLQDLLQRLSRVGAGAAGGVGRAGGVGQTEEAKDRPLWEAGGRGGGDVRGALAVLAARSDALLAVACGEGGHLEAGYLPKTSNPKPQTLNPKL